MKIDIKQINFIDKRLRLMLLEIEKYLGYEPTITSLYRIDDKGVHGTLPLRGVDIRVRHNAIGQIMKDFVNSLWSYDVNRIDKKCAVLHGEGANLHLHLQVHPRTRQKV